MNILKRMKRRPWDPRLRIQSYTALCSLRLAQHLIYIYKVSKMPRIWPLLWWWRGFPSGSDDKKSVVIRRPRFNCWVGKIPWRREWNQLQYSCWENPMGSQIRHNWAIYTTTTTLMIKEGFPGGAWWRIHLPVQETQEMQVWSLCQKIPWSRKWQPTPVFLPGKFHGQSSLTSYNSLCYKESEMTEHPQHDDKE